MAFSVLETRWSPEYFRRKEMMKTLQVPTISDTKDMAGLPLASLLFDQCYPELRTDYGLAPYLNGPQGDLWVAPNDSLNGKVVLTPSPTEKHMYALTHPAIIELGPALEQKFLNEGRLSKESALEQLEKFLMGVYETEKAALLAALREEEKLEYGSQLKKIQDYYDAEICKIVTECYEQIERLKEEMAEEVDSINIFWKDQAQQEINETVAKVTGKFLDKMKLQEQILVRIYIKQIRAIQDKKKCAINFERKKYNEKIKEMKHQLHCQNVADLMYLLCKERRRCKVERSAIRKHYVNRVRKMKSISKQKSNEIKDLMKLKIKRERQFIVREQCLVEILRQYQKFIYFALKAVPTQAEFLLNIDQLLKFELDDYGLTQQVTQTEVKPQSELQVLADHDLDTNEDIEDYLRHLQSLAVEEEFECSDVLPAFYYKDGMYVREDFRDMFSTGRQIGRNHPLWNPDVEELLNIFRKACEKPNSCQTDRVDSHLDNQRKLILGSDRSESTQIQTFSPELSKSAVRVSTMNAQHTKTKASTSANHAPEYEEEREIRKLSLGEGSSSPPRSHVLSKDNSANPLQHQMASNPNTQSRLTIARDSLILTFTTKERKSLLGFSKTLDEISKTDEDKLSKQEDRSTLTGSVDQPDEASGTVDLNQAKHTSKLLLACDSVELIRSKMDLCEKPSERDAKRKSQLTFSPRVSTTEAEEPLHAQKDEKPLEKSVKRSPPGGKKAAPSPRKATKVVPKATPRSAKAKVAGAKKQKEQVVEEFTEERINDLVHMMKENPSLLRLFTSCHK